MWILESAARSEQVARRWQHALLLAQCLAAVGCAEAAPGHLDPVGCKPACATTASCEATSRGRECVCPSGLVGNGEFCIDTTTPPPASVVVHGGAPLSKVVNVATASESLPGHEAVVAQGRNVLVGLDAEGRLERVLVHYPVVGEGAVEFSDEGTVIALVHLRLSYLTDDALTSRLLAARLRQDAEFPKAVTALRSLLAAGDGLDLEAPLAAPLFSSLSIMEARLLAELDEPGEDGAHQSPLEGVRLGTFLRRLVDLDWIRTGDSCADGGFALWNPANRYIFAEVRDAHGPLPLGPYGFKYRLLRPWTPVPSLSVRYLHERMRAFQDAFAGNDLNPLASTRTDATVNVPAATPAVLVRLSDGEPLAIAMNLLYVGAGWISLADDDIARFIERLEDASAFNEAIHRYAADHDVQAFISAVRELITLQAVAVLQESLEKTLGKRASRALSKLIQRVDAAFNLLEAAYRSMSFLTSPEGDERQTLDTSALFPGCARCANESRDGTETDVDCGGSCGACGEGRRCSNDSDCATKACLRGFCGGLACSNAALDEGETDVDCGGTCFPCAVGRACVMNTDCATSKCTRNVCVEEVSTWTTQFGTAGDDDATGVAVLREGDVVVTGFVRGPLQGVPAIGGVDGFLRRYRRDGTLVWSRLFGGGADDFPRRVAVDANDDIVVVGRTYGGFDGQSFHAGCAQQPAADAFVTKFQGDGTSAWTRILGTPCGDLAAAVAVDAAGAVFVAGATEGAFEGGTNGGGIDGFVFKLDTGGALAWSGQIAASGSQILTGIALHPNGWVFAAGVTETFSSLVASWTTAGGTRFAKVDHAAGELTLTSATISTDGLFVVAGSLDLGFGSHVLAMGYDSQCTRRWGFTGERGQLFSSAPDLARGIAAASDGSLLLVGSTGIGLPNQPQLTGQSDAFTWGVTAGVAGASTQFGTSFDDAANEVAFGPGGETYVVGSTGGSLAVAGRAGARDAFVKRLR